MRLAKLNSAGAVENVAVFDPENVPAWAADWVAYSDELPKAEQPPADLSPAQFEWLLAFTGLGNLWDGIEAALKDTDRAAYAGVRMQRKRTVYRLDVTLQEVARMRPVAAQIAPDVDLSDAAISAAWKLAEAV